MPAGGLGVSPRTADTEIFLGNEWNTSLYLQAQDRKHRISQREKVLVFRLLTAKSVEEDLMGRAPFQQELEK